jgi:murein DD-endopeptidase MepM/ murein hydrolase activator NlpD
LFIYQPTDFDTRPHELPHVSAQTRETKGYFVNSSQQRTAKARIAEEHRPLTDKLSTRALLAVLIVLIGLVALAIPGVARANAPVERDSACQTDPGKCDIAPLTDVELSTASNNTPLADDPTEVTTPAIEPAAAPEPTKDYTFVWGDTLTKLATATSVTIPKMQELNPDKLSNPDVIFAGDTVQMPASAALPTPAPVPASVPAAVPAPADTTAEQTPASTPASGLMNEHDWSLVAACESGTRGVPGSADWRALNPSGKYRGGLQFGMDTWNEFREPDFPSDPIEATPAQQIHTAEKLLAARNDEQWPECGDFLQPGTTLLPDSPAIEPASAALPASVPAPDPVPVPASVPAATPQASPGWTNPLQASYSCTSGFGPRWGTHHGGLDMALPVGNTVYAASSGIVKRAGATSGFGSAVVIFDPDTGIYTTYGHIRGASISVQEGQTVTAGQPIAESGNEGQSTGPHLHFGVGRGFFGAYIDPEAWMSEHGVSLC